MKTSELSGAALDWAVAKCEGEQPSRYTYYSTDWSVAGPIIHREQIDVFCRPSGSKYSKVPDWASAKYLYPNQPAAFLQSGPTPLIAAMRCFVSSRLGDEVEVPEGLA